MGAIGGLIGTAGGAGGTGFGGPQQAPIVNAMDMGDVNNANRSQNDLLKTLQSQRGLGKQQNVYSQTQGLANQLAQANGLGTMSGSVQGLQNLAGQYQNMANGVGPNPAQAALSNATGANIANQAAMMAGQRGAGSNVGLMARQAAMQGGALQQQAAGQGAEMQAQQQLAAMQGLGALQQNIAGIGAQQLGAQQSAQQALSGQANQMASNQLGQTNAIQQNTLNSINAQNQAAVGATGNINQANAAMAGQRMQGQSDFIGGMMNAGATAAKAGMAHGGPVLPMADGGAVPSGPMSAFGQFLSGWNLGGVNPNPGGSVAQIGATPIRGSSALAQGMDLSKAKQSPIPDASLNQNRFAQLPAEGPVGPGGTSQAPMGMMAPMGPSPPPYAAGGLANSGGSVRAKSPDQKATKKGDSYDNDKVPALLSEGEVVIPRSVLQSKDPVNGAAAFVAKVLAKRGK